jgi:hypothetical protein
MLCPDKIAALPIDDRYKEAISAFCSIPDNASACELLCDAPPDVIAMKFQQVEDELASYVEEGVPPELAAAAQQEAPEFAQAAGQFLQEAGPSILQQERKSREVQKFAKGGLASLGRFGDHDVAHVTKGEMVVPNYVLNDVPGLRNELNRVMSRMGADPARYTVGGKKVSINPRTGKPEFLSLGGIIGGIAGVALAPVTGGASLALAAGIGAAAGTMLDTGDPMEALMMGGAAFGLTSLAAGAGLFGAGAAGTTAGSIGGGLSAAEGMSAYAAGAGSAGTAGLAGAADAALIGSSAFPAAIPAGTAAMSAPAISSGMAGAGALGGGLTAGEAMVGGLSTTLPTASTMFPAAAAAPAATTAASTGGSTFLGGLWDKAAAFATEHPYMTAGLAASTLLPGMMTPEMPQRPAGYNLQTDPGAQYGGKEYETLGPEDLFGNIDEMGSGVPGSPGNPIQYGAAISAPSGYSYGQEMMQYGSPVNMQAQKDAYNYSVAPYGNVPKYVADGGHVRGPGTATSDSIPAYLSDGEFVMTSRAVRGAGNGSLRDGARRLYAMMDELERRA